MDLDHQHVYELFVSTMSSRPHLSLVNRFLRVNGYDVLKRQICAKRTLSGSSDRHW